MAATITDESATFNFTALLYAEVLEGTYFRIKILVTYSVESSYIICGVSCSLRWRKRNDERYSEMLDFRNGMNSCSNDGKFS